MYTIVFGIKAKKKKKENRKGRASKKREKAG